VAVDPRVLQSGYKLQFNYHIVIMNVRPSWAEPIVWLVAAPAPEESLIENAHRVNR
jgi:hypothetical protein